MADGGEGFVGCVEVVRRTRGYRRWPDAVKGMRRPQPIDLSVARDGNGMKRRVVGSLSVNRPGFPRGFFVQKLGGIFKGMCLFVECVLHFLRRPMPDGTV